MAYTDRIAILMGASGLVGGFLLKYLLDSNIYPEVIVFTRKKLGLKHLKLKEYIIDFDSPSTYKELIVGDDFFCCLGTTITKAKSEQAFRHVDYGYPVEFARIAKENGVKQFLFVSSIGANPQSSVFYLKTKGQCEEAISELGFNSVSIFRPASLIGNRTEFRLNEKLTLPLLKTLSFLLVGRLQKYRPIKATKVAESMLKCALNSIPGNTIYESDKIDSI